MTKSKTVFPTDNSLLKMLYLAMMDITKKLRCYSWDGAPWKALRLFESYNDFPVLMFFSQVKFYDMLSGPFVRVSTI